MSDLIFAFMDLAICIAYVYYVLLMFICCEIQRIREIRQ